MGDSEPAEGYESLQGKLLVASPALEDPNFKRTVVLLIQHGEEGAFGLVLNRQTTATLRKIWKNVSATPCASDACLYVGGPVNGPPMVLHSSEEHSENEIAPGVFFSAQVENLARLVELAEPRVRWFVGYAGWGGGQLERELAEGAWLSWDASADLVFGEAEAMWETALKAIFEAHPDRPPVFRRFGAEPQPN